MRNRYTYGTSQLKHIVLLIGALLIGLCAFAQQGTWTWMQGDSTAYGATVAGTQGVSDSLNTPGGAYESARWKDLDGNLWIFGGVMGGYEWGALWKFDPTTAMWTWMHGVPSMNVPGIYGTQGVPSPGNRPGSRGWGCATWTDQSGDLWMFGGWGMDMNGQIGPLADLWRYHIATNEWTWMNGAQNIYSFGSYGTVLVPNATNAPPCRQECIANWADTSGNLWLYGGTLEANNNTYADMWKYSIATNTWTWMNGAYSGGPSYGTLQVAAPSNTPGSRGAASSWTDSQGNFWMYGGSYFNAGFDYGDMWKFDPVTNLWTWMAGTGGSNPPCTFTTPNVAGNGVPGARFEAKSTWIDECDRMWSFGGFVYAGQILTWDQLWMFDPATNLFTWVDGSSSWSPGPGLHGTYQTSSPNNYPNASGGVTSMTDDAGNIWLFGGWIFTTSQGGINTMWRYEPVQDSCSITTNIYQGSNGSFIAYPNPGQGNISIQLSEELRAEDLTIKLFDASGRCVVTLTNLESSLITLHIETSGLFLLVLENAKGEIIGSRKLLNLDK